MTVLLLIIFHLKRIDQKLYDYHHWIVQRLYLAAFIQNGHAPLGIFGFILESQLSTINCTQAKYCSIFSFEE